MFGCHSPAHSRISRRKRSVWLSTNAALSSSPTRSILIATSWPVDSCRALYTRPKLPSPSRETISYRSLNTPPRRAGSGSGRLDPEDTPRAWTNLDRDHKGKREETAPLATVAESETTFRRAGLWRGGARGGSRPNADRRGVRLKSAASGVAYCLLAGSCPIVHNVVSGEGAGACREPRPALPRRRRGRGRRRPLPGRSRRRAHALCEQQRGGRRAPRPRAGARRRALDHRHLLA